MFPKLVLSACLALVCAFPARAQSLLPLPSALPLPVPSPADLRPVEWGPDLEPACAPVYLNESQGTGMYVPAGTDVELADDLHTTAAGTLALCAVDFGYFAPGSGPIEVVITVYANDPGDGAPGAILAGPYNLSGLPPGLQAFRVDLPAGSVAPDVWLGVSFGDSDAGLLAFGPPTMGSSHDLVWRTPPGGPGSFGGNPTANLYLGLHASPSTPGRVSTWGEVKAIYR